MTIKILLKPFASIYNIIENFAQKLTAAKLSMVFFAVLFVVYAFGGFFYVFLEADMLIYLYSSLFSRFRDYFYGLVRFTDSRWAIQFLLMLPMNLMQLAGSVDLPFMLRITSFWVSFFSLLLLFVNYLVIPKNKKIWFVFPLLSYLLCKSFLPFSLWHTAMYAGMLFWIIFSIYLFNDLSKISRVKISVLIISILILIKSYETALFFAPALILLAVIKIKKHSGSVPRFMHISIILLGLCFFYQAYLFFRPSHHGGYIMDAVYWILIQNYIVIIFMLLALAISAIRNKKIYYMLGAVISVAFGLGLLNYTLYAFRKQLPWLDNFSFFYFSPIPMFCCEQLVANIAGRLASLLYPILFAFGAGIFWYFKLKVRFGVLWIFSIILLISFSINFLYWGEKFKMTLLYLNSQFSLQSVRIETNYLPHLSFPLMSFFIPIVLSRESEVKIRSLFVLSDDFSGDFSDSAWNLTSENLLPDLSRYRIRYSPKLTDGSPRVRRAISTCAFCGWN
ncbi:MAG: hypothetical protein FWC85_01745 [Elusimicrobia bacterium]|nr:hypothetical protein [Elusimicrobiota bacterium]